MSLREAARRCSRSVTTLRRYIRRGRLDADKRPGRFGPEYHVSSESLERAGLRPQDRDAPSTALVRANASQRSSGLPARDVFQEVVPLSLYQELLMKHEQLLVQYGAVRSAGRELFGLRNEIETQRGALRRSRTENEDLTRRLREAELELEGRALEIAALREKVRALEMLTRDSATTEALEQQFNRVIDQSRKVLEMATEARANTPPRDGAEH